MSDVPTSNVTVADLYHEMVAMRADLAAVLAKVERADDRGGRTERTQSDHEARIRVLENAVPTSLEVRIMSLEKFRWQVLGALVVIQALGVVIEWLFFTKK